MSAPEACRFLPWDSEFFGCRIARVSGDSLDSASAAAVDAYCAAERIDCVYLLVSSGDLASAAVAQEHGFRLVDIRVTFERPAGGDAPPSDGVRRASAADLPALRAIARASHHDSRFYADPRFSRPACDRLYETWIERSVEGWADAVYVVEADGAPAGYVTCHRDSSASGSIGLIAVAADRRGRGFGRRLAGAALAHFRRENLDRVTVVTQGRNLASQRLYQRCGFVTGAVQLWYHRWSFSK